MPNRIFAVRFAPIKGGTEVQGLARSDRGTRYILGSVVVLHPKGERKSVKPALDAAVETILKGGI